MAHTDSARRIGRPTHVERWVDGVDADGNVIIVDRVIEHGRRAGLHTHRSQTAYHRTSSNRRERRAVRVDLRRDPDAVSARPRKNDSIWLTR